MLVHCQPPGHDGSTEVAEALSKDLKRKRYPVFAAMMEGMDVENGRVILDDAGIPTTQSGACRTFLRGIVRISRNLRLLQEIPSRFLRDVAQKRIRRKN